MTSVIKTHLYGKREDVFSVLFGYKDGEPESFVETGAPSLESLEETLGDSFVPQSEIEDVISSLESVGGVAFTEEEKLEFAKGEVKKAIKAYDVSDAVNGFILRHDGAEVSYWLPAAKRGQLVNSVNTWSGTHDTYRLDLREYYTYFDIGCTTLLQLLSDLENYAVECYNTTSAHRAAVESAATLGDVLAYDYTKGYPEKLEVDV